MPGLGQDLAQQNAQRNGNFHWQAAHAARNVHHAQGRRHDALLHQALAHVHPLRLQHGVRLAPEHVRLGERLWLRGRPLDAFRRGAVQRRLNGGLEVLRTQHTVLVCAAHDGVAHLHTLRAWPGLVHKRPAVFGVGLGRHGCRAQLAPALARHLHLRHIQRTAQLCQQLPVLLPGPLHMCLAGRPLALPRVQPQRQGLAQPTVLVHRQAHAGSPLARQAQAATGLRRLVTARTCPCSSLRGWFVS